jgi:predicted transcriptional regulator of viral defense system
MNPSVNKLQSLLRHDTIMSNIEIATLFREFEPNLNQTTINWRIYSLVQSGMIDRVGRGKFSISTRDKFTPIISSRIYDLKLKLKKEFPYLSFCLWDTSILNEFMIHQPGLFYTIVEVEKDATESVFYFLKDQKHTVFINPSSEMLERYVQFDQHNIIVKNFITEAPTKLIEDVNTVTLEKVLVDIFCDTTLFSAQQGVEMRTIFQEAFRKYSLNTDKMFRYSARRGNKKNFGEFFSSILIKQ